MTSRRPRLQWVALTLPLPLAAVSIYAFAEWLFFVTKPSMLTVVPWAERWLILAETSWPFVPLLLAIQLPATLLSLIAFPRLRELALLPSSAILAFLALVLFDNFTHVLFGFSSINVDLRLGFVYALGVVIVTVLSCRALQSAEASWRSRGAVVPLLLWFLAAPSLLMFVVMEARRPEGDALPVAGSPLGPVAGVAARPRPNILLLSSDGIEARRVSAYGYAKRTTPMLDSLSRETLFCENAFANSCTTYAAMVTLLTGKLPGHSGVIDPPSMLHGDARYEHLPGILRSQGYRTIQLTMLHYADAGQANLVGAFDLANYGWEGLRMTRLQSGTDAARSFRLQMFERWRARVLRIFAAVDADPYRAVVDPRYIEYWQDERKVSTLLRFVDETPEPWFAHVHLLDSHRPQADFHFDYDESIRASDASMAKILGHLRERGQLDRTVVVISSDHARGWHARERVPLLIRFPRGQHALRVRRNVQMTDVAPTLLDYLGLPIPPWMDGRSLLRPESPNEKRTILSVCGSAAGMIGSGPPSPGLPQTATVFLGSWWHELTLADGSMRSGPVDQHTLRTPPTPESAARAVVADAIAVQGTGAGSETVPDARARAGAAADDLR